MALARDSDHYFDYRLLDRVLRIINDYVTVWHEVGWGWGG